MMFIKAFMFSTWPLTVIFVTGVQAALIPVLVSQCKDVLDRLPFNVHHSNGIVLLPKGGPALLRYQQ